MRGLSLHPLGEVALLAAHCDDLAIGAGATLWQLCRAHPGLTVRALVLTGGGTPREAEERAALARLCPGATLELTVLAYPDGRVPGRWAEAKADVARFARAARPDVVFCPQPRDAHQDHRAVAEWSRQEFRDHPLLGYEIVKFEADLPDPTLLVPLDDAALAAKLAVLAECYPSQHGHGWFDADTFRGLARIRGVHAASRWAEGFVASNLTWTISKEQPCASC